MTQHDWQLHPQLATDTHYLGQLRSAHLLLHRDAALHWLLLVPETDVLDLLDLPAEEREVLLGDATAVATRLKQNFAYPRVNVGALGLVVPQLHLHVVGRRPEDPCWPAPVWGQLSSGIAYEPRELAALTELFIDAT